MSNAPEPPAPTPSPADVVREAEQADEDKTADDAPAPAHSPHDRKLLVRDAHGLDPYGDQDKVELGQAPYEVPAATAAQREPPQPPDPRDISLDDD